VFPVAISIFWAGYVTRYLHQHWKRDVIEGFPDAVNHIPAGKSVLYLLSASERFTLNHPYLVQYYVADRGGFAVPTMKGLDDAVWVRPKRLPDSPMWGQYWSFQWSRHSRDFDYFLLEQPITGRKFPGLPGAPPGAATLVFQKGRWQVFQKVATTPATPPAVQRVTR
jgi:hypothetical protein